MKKHCGVKFHKNIRNKVAKKLMLCTLCKQDYFSDKIYGSPEERTNINHENSL